MEQRLQVDAMTCELWEAESGHAIGGYNTEEAALRVVRATIDQHGRDAVDTWLLMHEDKRGRSKAMEKGCALADRAMRVALA